MPEEVVISIRAKLPRSVHNKISSHQRRLAAKKDRFIRFDEALVDYIKNSTTLNNEI